MSLKQIAELTGVSPATVSRVLNNPDYHCQDRAVTEKIREAARKSGYVPNSSARELKKGSVHSDNVFKVDVFLARFNSINEDAFFNEVFRHLETEMINQRCVLNQILKAPDIALRKSGNELIRSVGLIILGKCPSNLVYELKKEYKAVVAIDRNPTQYELDEVICNGAKAASTAIEYLLSLGHRSIGYIGDCNMESRYSGYYECLLGHRIPLIYDYVVSTGQTREEGYRAYDRLAEKGRQPTAVFCANDVTALGFLQAMKDKTGRKKKDVYRPAVVSIDDIEEASLFSPMLTTVHIPKKDMVHMAVMLLCDRLNGLHQEYVRVEFPCHIMIRESSGVHVY